MPGRRVPRDAGDMRRPRGSDCDPGPLPGAVRAGERRETSAAGHISSAEKSL